MSSWKNVLYLLEEVAFDHPHRIALEQGSRQLSYSQLWLEVEHLGGSLLSLGVGEEQVVGLALGRSIDHVVGCFASWYAGGAFLPLDLSWPDRRLAEILAEARPAVVLTTAAHRDRLRGLYHHVETPDDLLRHAAQPAPFVNHALAYLIYTSGSTGRPKGVEVTHTGIRRVLIRQIAEFRLGPDSRCLWHLRPAFDASISDIGTCLLAGATLVIEDDEKLRDPAALTRLMHQHRITHIDLPPSLLPYLSAEEMPASLETVIIGGEVCPPAVVCHWARSFRVVNVYGPTEATICTSLCECDPETWKEPLLGSPLPDVYYRLLDDEGCWVERGNIGELHIGGACLARGYRGQPELTARKFLTNAQGRPIYFRTGDRVRLRSDGAYVFVGRTDRMIKLRGILIAPEEIEARLCQVPGVIEAAVVERDGGLVAFLAGDPPGDRDVREVLSRSMPLSMQPRRLIRLGHLPRTGSGKLDFVRLAAMHLPNEATVRVGGTRGELLAMASKVLGGARLDLGAGFLDQGGDSLSLLRLVALGGRRGWAVPPALLAAKSLGEVADFLDRPDAAPPGGLSAAALRQDVEGLAERLRAERTAADVTTPPAAANVLLTGATGFLGSYLLFELLRQTEAEVVCLVRAADTTAARERLFAALAQRGLTTTTKERRRVHVLLGDVGAPNMGLSAAAWGQLAGRVEAVYHAAAQVHLVRPYVDLCPDNVAGTYQVLRLCAKGQAKWLHYLSTLSVFVATDRDSGTAREDDDLSATRWVHGGYAQSKYAAEWLARRALPRGGLTVYRPGLITPDSRGGRRGPARDLLSLFLRGAARLGCLPCCDRQGLKVDLTPVDYAARAIVRLSLHAAGRAPDTFHLAAPCPASLADLAAALARGDVALAEVDEACWRERLATLEGEDAAAWLALCRALPGDFARYRTLDLFQAGDVTFDMKHTRTALRGTGIDCPPADDALLSRYVAAALG